MEVFSDGSLKEAVQGRGPTIVIFAAQWCSPSQRLVRALQQVEMKSPDLSLGVLDVDIHSAFFLWISCLRLDYRVQIELGSRSKACHASEP